jgi:hypothetical protein
VRLLVVILSFLLATGLEAVGSFFCLIPTQGMHGNEPFLKVFLYLSTALVVVNLVGAAIGLFPLGLVYDVGTWWRGVLGFMAGSILSALCLCVEFLLIPRSHASVLIPVRMATLVIGALSPPAGGVIALRRRQRDGRTAAVSGSVID